MRIIPVTSSLYCVYGDVDINKLQGLNFNSFIFLCPSNITIELLHKVQDMGVVIFDTPDVPEYETTLFDRTISHIVFNLVMSKDIMCIIVPNGFEYMSKQLLCDVFKKMTLNDKQVEMLIEGIL